MKTCPVCHQEVAFSPKDYGRFLELSCPVCGELQLHESCYSRLCPWADKHERQFQELRAAVAAHQLKYGRTRILFDDDAPVIGHWIEGLT